MSTSKAAARAESRHRPAGAAREDSWEAIGFGAGAAVVQEVLAHSESQSQSKLTQLVLLY